MCGRQATIGSRLRIAIVGNPSRDKAGSERDTGERGKILKVIGVSSWTDRLEVLNNLAQIQIYARLLGDARELSSERCQDLTALMAQR